MTYRMQELDYGGLSKANQRRLTALTKGLQTNGSLHPIPGYASGPERSLCGNGAEGLTWSSSRLRA